MSIWKKVISDVLASGVSAKMLEETLNEMGIGLDYSIKNLKNSYGRDTCDAAFTKDGRVLSLGIKFNKDKGIELIGDIWGTNLGIDGKQEALMDKIAHNYQVNNVKEQVQKNNWFIENQYVENGKTVIEIMQY